MRKECVIMNEPSNERQSVYGGHQVLEMQQPPTNQQEAGAGSNRQEEPPAQSGSQQYLPPGYYRPRGYQPYAPGQQQYGYQQPYGSLYPGNVPPFERTSLGIRARTAGTLCYLFG